MKVGYCQFAPALDDVAGNLRRMREFINDAARQGIKLLVLPELSNSGYNFSTRGQLESTAESPDSGPTLDMWREMARREEMNIVGGFAERNGGVFYNSAALVTPDGRTRVYRKLHLFYKETEWFVPGDELPPVADIGEARVGMMICFDWVFPELARILALNGADIICHPSNIVTAFPPLALLVRGVENRVYTVTANRVGEEQGRAGRLRYRGLSQITSPDGDRLAESDETAEEVRAAELDIAGARDKRLGGYTDIFAARRPELYRPLAAPPSQ